MFTEGSGSEKYLLIIITGLVSLIVGVGSGWLLDFLRTQSPKLVYSITGAEMFPGQNQKTGIVLVRIGNAGAKEAEDVLFRTFVPEATIREQKVTGIPKVEQLAKVTSNTLELKIPFLNPNEQILVHLLLDLRSGQLQTPVVELRAKGVSGSQDSVTEKERSDRSQLLSLSGGILAALGTSLAFLMLLRRLGFSLGATHHDDQRDVFAYVLDIHGLHLVADDVRRTSRSMTYWAITDQLVGRWLASGQKNDIEQGSRALEHLLSYAGVAPSSQDLIRVSLARLQAAIGDNAGALRQLGAVKYRNAGVIKRRIGDDPRLSALISESKGVDVSAV